MANLMHREPTRVGLAGLPPLPPDDTPRDGAAGDRQRLDIGAGLESRMSAPNAASSDELTSLRVENLELRRRVEELEYALLESDDSDETAWAERQREFESLLEQKSETIRDLHRQLQEALKAPRGGEGARLAEAPAAGSALKEECIALQQQLEQEGRRLDEERQQLKDDEQALMTQMREMELSLSRDRAELARQRSDLQRLQNDLNRELEQAGRDSGLRERLLALRRGQETITSNTAASGTSATTSSEAQSAPKKSGLFRRIFGA